MTQEANFAESIRTPEEGAVALPEAFMRWQLEERRDLFLALERGEHPRTFGAHLPAVSTLGPGPFPVHSANKGVGLTPKDEALPELLEEIRSCITWAADRPWHESQARRIATTRLLYDHPESIDPRRFGLIEIFRGKTYRNILQDPRVTLLFTGVAPQWRSYQVNCVAEIVEPGDPRFELIFGMRQLFERDGFHIQQPEYPLGYLFWVRDVVEKTPRFGDAGRRLTGEGER